MTDQADPSQDNPRTPAGGWIQWKGTNVCVDLHCECGATGHFDGGFMYYVRCAKCGRHYEVGANIKLIAVDPLVVTGKDYIPFGGDGEAAALPLVEARPQCWCGSEVGARTPGDADGLGCLAVLEHEWRATPEAEAFLQRLLDELRSPLDRVQVVTAPRPDLDAIRSRAERTGGVLSAQWAVVIREDMLALIAEVERLNAVVAEGRALVAQRDERGATWVVRRVSALISDGES